jgi:nitroreductase
MDTIAAIHARRSIRDYLPRAVEQSLIEVVIDDAAQAPWTPLSAPEPWVFTIIRGAERIRAYGARALQYARDNRPDGEGWSWTENPDFSVFYNAPIVIVISGKSDNRHALEECTRAGQTLSIAAVARGLGTCWVGAPVLWLHDPDVCVELAIPEGFTPHAVFTLGYSATIPKSPGTISTRTNWIGDGGS